MYPGWRGLNAASVALGEDLLLPLYEAGRGRWQRYDWQAGRPAEWHTVVSGSPVIVEGCGSITGATSGYADLSVWLDAADDLRKARALSRDDGGFDDYWDIWQEQFDAHLSANDPRARSDLVLDAARWDRASGR
jgi:uridine kinase